MILAAAPGNIGKKIEREDFFVSLDEILKAANKVKTSGSRKWAKVKGLTEIRALAGVKCEGCLYWCCPQNAFRWR